MNDVQMTIGKQSRWIVKEIYEGRFDTTSILCACTCISEASVVCDACCKLFHGRPFTFMAVHIADDFDPDYDSLFHRDILGNTVDFTKYVDGVSSLEG